MVISGTSSLFAEPLKIEGTITSVDHEKSLIEISTGKSLETGIRFSKKTRFLNEKGQNLPPCSILPGDGIRASIAMKKGTADSIVIKGITIAGELVFINGEKLLTASGDQVYFSPGTKFYLNGIETQWKNLEKGRRVFVRINPDTNLGGMVYQVDINKRLVNTGKSKAKIWNVETTPPGPFRKNQVLKITVKASGRKHLSGDIPGVASGIPLKETKPGIYEGEYRFNRTDVRRTYVIVRLNDKTGTICRVGTNSLDVAVSPPIIEPVYPLPGKSLTNNNIELFARLRSPGSLVKSSTIEVRLNGKPIKSGIERNVGFVSCELPSLKAGRHSLKISVSDEAGNKSSETWEFTIKN